MRQENNGFIIPIETALRKGSNALYLEMDLVRHDSSKIAVACLVFFGERLQICETNLVFDTQFEFP